MQNHKETCTQRPREKKRLFCEPFAVSLLSKYKQFQLFKIPKKKTEKAARSIKGYLLFRHFLCSSIFACLTIEVPG